MEPKLTGSQQYALLMSLLKSRTFFLVVLMILYTIFIKLSMEGKTKGCTSPKKMSALMPSLTDAPLGNDRSTMVRRLCESFLGTEFRGETAQG